MKAFSIYGDSSVSATTALVFAPDSDAARRCASLSTGISEKHLKAKRIHILDRFARQGVTQAYREYSPDYLEIAGLSSSSKHSIPDTLEECRRALIEERLRGDMAWSVLLDLAEQIGIDPEEARKNPGDPAKIIMKKALKSKIILERFRKKASEWNEDRISNQMVLSESDSNWLCDQLKLDVKEKNQ